MFFRAMAGTFRAPCRDIGTLRPLFGRVPVMALSATLTLRARDNIKLLLQIPLEPESLTVSIPLNRPDIFISQVDVVSLTSGGWYTVCYFLWRHLSLVGYSCIGHRRKWCSWLICFAVSTLTLPVVSTLPIFHASWCTPQVR